MLEARPEIHRHRPDLNLHLRVDNAVRQKDRYRHQHVIAFVSALLWMPDIILHGDYREIILLADHFGKAVNIRRKRTDNPDSRNVVDVIHHIVDRGVIAIPL